MKSRPRAVSLLSMAAAAAVVLAGCPSPGKWAKVLRPRRSNPVIRD